MAPVCPVCRLDGTRAFAAVDGRRYWRCVHCEATFLDPAQYPTPARERAEYLRHRNDPADPGYRAFLARLAAPLLARLAPGAEGLDYGCGPGPALAAMLAEAGHRVSLYDPFFHPDEAALARRYDFVSCTEVVEHFHRPAAEFARLGIRIERVLTDNGAAYKSIAYRDAVTRLGARHKRTRPWRPQTNGKAERVIQTLLHEWAYARPYTSNRERAEALPAFVDFYNRRRPHTALAGRSPLDAVNNVPGDHT